MMRFRRKGSFMMAMAMPVTPMPSGGTMCFQFAPETTSRMQHTEASSMVVPKSGPRKIKPVITAMTEPGIKRPYLNSRMRVDCHSAQAARPMMSVILASSEG